LADWVASYDEDDVLGLWNFGPAPCVNLFESIWIFDIKENESRRRVMVDKDRIKGSVEKIKGKVKEWAGKITGDTKTEAEGKTDQVKGKVQNTVGGLKDTVRGK
jgi:uncharacterized protein YjbJ (UPF0337 family)